MTGRHAGPRCVGSGLSRDGTAVRAVGTASRASRRVGAEPPPKVLAPGAPLSASHCSVTPLFTSYVSTQMWFRVFFPRHILHGRMLSVS